jgi:hypothetical protein
MPPTADAGATHWRDIREAIMAGIEAWRLHHPKASLQEIEKEGKPYDGPPRCPTPDSDRR